ncbi:hypothetical protein A9Q84_12610 [Halobacteriovorax marinus]|uniref:D-alanyl-D-alanine carboxypeptidase-like core domain-containing protein n=1 Tax=Halobacteriovorax marinus TaxID=97084 RepID=A0A1Y5FEZ6_9BACT|nr:hypothetical protein A9Q84_12610 [Halobacteriovorax marinus]
MKLNKLILGLDQSSYQPVGDYLIHPDALESFLKLRELCANEGFDLCLTSSFRSFEAQKRIWNAKAQGKRALLDDQGNPIDFTKLNNREIVYAILRWSALPGMSRHHWGTDLDVYDKFSLPSPDYNIQLTPEEVAPEGIFGKLHLFLDKIIEENKSFGFYRPYKEDLGGVAPEKWHLSHHPTSSLLLEELNFDFFSEFINSQDPNDFELIDIVIEYAKEIYENYVINVHRDY